MVRTSALVLACTLVLATGCAKKPTAPEIATVPTTSANVGNVHVDGELAKLCNVTFGNVDRAPKFDFDKTDLSNEDRNVIQQVATCVTTGPLHGHALSLVGRADPRGEAEYNMGLGEHRADAVRRYLQALGVPPAQLTETSRGKLDATGTDDASWQRDRRVDVALR